MNRAIGTLLDCRYMHRCAAVFDGEWGVIDRTKIRNNVRQVDDGLGGLDERQPTIILTVTWGPVAIRMLVWDPSVVR